MWMIAPDSSTISPHPTMQPRDISTAYRLMAPLRLNLLLQKTNKAATATTYLPNGEWAFHTWSTFDRPPVTELIRLPNHQVVRTLESNIELAQKVNQEPGFPDGVLPDEDRRQCDARRLDDKPPDFDPARKYPVLVYVYGEPAATTVKDEWGGERGLFHRAIAHDGYIILSFDNQGTPAPKGRAWRKMVYGDIGGPLFFAAGRSHPCFRRRTLLCRHLAHGHLGLERRGIEYLEPDVPLPWPFYSGNVRCSHGGPTLLRHHLPGTLHGIAQG